MAAQVKLHIERKVMYRQMMESIIQGLPRHSLDVVDLPEDIKRILGKLLERFAIQLSDGPYRDVVERVLRGELSGDSRSVDGELINVLPGDLRLACTRISLALSMGTSPTSPLSFTAVMRSVREHLIDCQHISRVVVLLTDSWSPRQIEEHVRDIEAHRRMGRIVLPYLVSGGRITPVEWPRRLSV
jgi:hypothetical protein